MLKRIFLLFLSVLIIVTFSSCNKKDRELYQGEQTVYVQVDGGLLLDVSAMLKQRFSPLSEIQVSRPHVKPSLESRESTVRNHEHGVILLVQIDEYPRYVTYRVENHGSIEYHFSYETSMRVREIFFQGEEAGVEVNDVLIEKTEEISFITSSSTVLPDSNNCIPAALFMSSAMLTMSEEEAFAMANEISWTMLLPDRGSYYEDGTPVKVTFPFMRKGYSYIIYGYAFDGQMDVSYTSHTEVSTDEDHAQFYKNLGLDDPEFAEIRAQVLEKYWYN